MDSSVMRGLGLHVLACLLVLVLASCATAPATKLSDLAGLQQRADVAYVKHTWREAADDYKALTERIPGNAAYWFRLGNCLARLDQPAPAVNAYRAALQRDPHIAPAWHNLGSVLLQQSQAAFQQAAGHAKPSDPLGHESTLLASRIAAVRAGTSTELPPEQPANPQPAPAASSSAALITPLQSAPDTGQGGVQ